MNLAQLVAAGWLLPIATASAQPPPPTEGHARFDGQPATRFKSVRIRQSSSRRGVLKLEAA